MEGIRLITTAEQFGRSAQINEAVDSAVGAGTLTSASFMVSMPRSEEAARIVKRWDDLAVGLQLNLTCGTPLSDGGFNHFAARGAFGTKQALQKRAFWGHVHTPAAEAELRSQLAAMRGMGLEPDHISGYEDVHMLPGVFPAVERVAAEQGLAISIPRSRFLNSGQWNGNTFSRWVRSLYLRFACVRSGAARPDRNLLVCDESRSLLDLSPVPDRFGEKEAEVVVRSLRPGLTEWTFSPSACEADPEQLPLPLRRHLDEYRLLTSDWFKWFLTENAIELTSYRHVRPEQNTLRAAA